MTPRKEHGDFCNLLCICCLSKKHVQPVKYDGTVERYMTHDYPSLIKEHFWSEYNPENPDIPQMICRACKVHLIRISSAEAKPFPTRPKYEGIN